MTAINVAVRRKSAARAARLSLRIGRTAVRCIGECARRSFVGLDAIAVPHVCSRLRGLVCVLLEYCTTRRLHIHPLPVRRASCQQQPCTCRRQYKKRFHFVPPRSGTHCLSPLPARPQSCMPVCTPACRPWVACQLRTSTHDRSARHASRSRSSGSAQIMATLQLRYRSSSQDVNEAAAGPVQCDLVPGKVIFRYGAKFESGEANERSRAYSLAHITGVPER